VVRRIPASRQAGRITLPLLLLPAVGGHVGKGEISSGVLLWVPEQPCHLIAGCVLGAGVRIPVGLMPSDAAIQDGSGYRRWVEGSSGNRLFSLNGRRGPGSGLLPRCSKKSGLMVGMILILASLSRLCRFFVALQLLP